MSQRATSILIGLMELALLAFTGSRTLDLLQQLLPANQSIFAYLGLVAFDGGLVGWSLFFVYGAHGSYQRAISLLMIVVSLVAIGISVIADLIISASDRGLVDAMPEQGRLAVLIAVGVIVFVNVAAFFLAFITEPDRLRAMAVESAKDKIHARSLALISQKAEAIAPDMAEQLSEQWVEQTYVQMGLKRNAPPVRAPMPLMPPRPLTVNVDDLRERLTKLEAITGEFRALTPEDVKKPVPQVAPLVIPNSLNLESEGNGNGHRPFRRS